MSRRLRIHAVLPALLALAAATSPAAADVAWFDGELDEALAVAREENKLVLLDCWATWCTYCHQMDREVWTNEHLARSLASEVVPVKAEVDIFTGVGLDLNERYAIDGLPIVLLLDPKNGSELVRLAGYSTAERVAGAIERAWRELDPERSRDESAKDAARLMAEASRKQLAGDAAGALSSAEGVLEKDDLCTEDLADDAALLVAELSGTGAAAPRAEAAVSRAASACSRADRGEELWTVWAEIRGRTAGPEAAGEILDQKVALFPKSGEALVEYLDWAKDVTLTDDQRRVAEQRAEAAVTLLPGDTRPLAHLARLRLERGDATAAMDILEEAIALDPHDPGLRRLRLRILLGRASNG